MIKFIRPCVLLLVLSLALASCHSSERDIPVSERFGICARLPDKVLHAPTEKGATDFETTELKFGDARGGIYVGDFPDFPKFNPNVKFYESVGEVRYVGKAEKLGIENYLYRVGLGSQPSIHVLVQIPEADVEFNKAWEQGANMRIVACD
ncbi:hypothetical protein [Thermomonas hydrothermalis]|uniref:Lipoprotein n=1 Tax=Thermomonas hydrothermalis TaxID=213588 RepID=A0A1M5B8B5_9GAMM|nr:hypothetical protein [Thermomonas hydrothermalis]SHF38688.1 hypothetical protein SAMN02745204_02379 [Thermomonas hydrothermalis]